MLAFATSWKGKLQALPYKNVFFSYTKISTQPLPKSQNMNPRSLSTFDSRVSCLYFFVSEYACPLPVFRYEHMKSWNFIHPASVQLHCHPD